MSSRRLENVFSFTIFPLPKISSSYLGRCLQDAFKTSWKSGNCNAENAFKTCFQDIFKICLEIVFQMSWRRTKYLLGRKLNLFLANLNLYLTNLCVTNKAIPDKSRANPRQIQDALIRTK